MRYQVGRPNTATARLNLADAENLNRVAAALPDRGGEPFLNDAGAVQAALAIAARVIEAGELERFRPQPASALPDGPSADPADAPRVAAFLARFAGRGPA